MDFGYYHARLFVYCWRSEGEIYKERERGECSPTRHASLAFWDVIREVVHGGREGQREAGKATKGF